MLNQPWTCLSAADKKKYWTVYIAIYDVIIITFIIMCYLQLCVMITFQNTHILYGIQ